MARSIKRRSACPISFALDLFGDRWSLLVIRDMMFKGKRTYGEFLKAGEGIATNILADRLETLENAGVIDKAPDPDNGTRYLYSLTDRGLDLMPVMLEIIAWSGKHDPKTPVSAAFRKRIVNSRDKVMAEFRSELETQQDQ